MLPPLEERYRRTHDALANLESALLSITKRRADYGPNFHFDAVQFVEEILKLRAQIDEIIGLTAFVKEFGLPTDPDAPATAPSPSPATGSPSVEPVVS